MLRQSCSKGRKTDFFRLCADFKVHVNDKIMTEDYPLSDIETLFHELEGSKFTSTLTYHLLITK